MTDPSSGPSAPGALHHQIDLKDDQEVGVFADFASVWHTPNTFVLDFIAVKMPPQAVVNETGTPTGDGVLPSRVAARVRIPPEQIFQLITALTEQGQAWLNETGRSEPPEGWMNPPGAA